MTNQIIKTEDKAETHKKVKTWDKFHKSILCRVNNIWDNPETSKIPEKSDETLAIGFCLINQLTEDKISAFLKFVVRLEWTIALSLSLEAYRKFGEKFSINEEWINYFNLMWSEGKLVLPEIVP